MHTMNGESTNEVVAAYTIRRPLQVEFTRRIVELVRELLRSAALDVHLIESRTKDVSSFRDKITRASKAYADPLSEITDLSGIRIIAYYEDEIALVSRLIEREFRIHWEQSSIEYSIPKPEEFGYRSTHYVVSLDATRGSLTEWSQYQDLRAEIQVRTVLQHAWAAISHKLQYKRELEVPSRLRRQLNRLSALMELADEQFLSLRDASAAISALIEIDLAAGKTDVEINRLSIAEFLRTSELVQELITLAENHGFESTENWGLNPECLPDDYHSELTESAQHAGLTTIAQLEDVLDSNLSWVDGFFGLLMAKAGNWMVDAAFMCELILIGRHPNQFDPDWLVAHGWGRPVAERVLKVANSLLEEHSNRSEGDRDGI